MFERLNHPIILYPGFKPFRQIPRSKQQIGIFWFIKSMKTLMCNPQRVKKQNFFPFKGYHHEEISSSFYSGALVSHFYLTVNNIFK